MASLRQGRPTCIRAAFSTAGFRKWQRHARHRLQVPSCPSPQFWTGGRSKFLDPYDGDSEDAPGHSNYRAYLAQRICRFLGNRNRSVPSYPLTITFPEVSVEQSHPPMAPDPAVRTTSRAPAPLEAADVDMQPVGEVKALGPQDAGALSAAPEDWRTPRVAGPLVPEGLCDIGRHLLGKARVTLQPPRLGNERDRGPKLSLSKRKLELILAEPEKSKRKK
uniref:RIKEN cDNA 1700001K19 gene n=1 Tax=Jaculus jaculus TaxID=51337 RepID=A0A8C5K3C0_JACJA